MVIIDRLPFSPPDEPIHQAVVERLKARGTDWFGGYVVPNAIIKLKQGIGRLLRTTDDRGVIALLDTRLRSKGYGRTILTSLPKMSVTETLDDVASFFGETKEASIL